MRRLAARLVPRFLHLFPDQMSVVVNMLIGMNQSRYRAPESDADSIVTVTKTDVLKGLGSCIETASRIDGDAAVLSVQNIVEFLLR